MLASIKVSGILSNTGHTGFCSALCNAGAPVTPVTAITFSNASHLHHILSVRLQRLQSERLDVPSGEALRHLKQTRIHEWNCVICLEVICKMKIIQACTALSEIRTRSHTWNI